MNRIRDFESQTIAAEQMRIERDYWLSKLSGEITKSCFPYDNKKALIDEKNMEIVKFGFPGDVSARLVKINNGFDPNLYMILMAGVVLLLNKYTGNKDIIIGTPVLKQELEKNFVNTVLVIRNPVDGNMTFKEFLQQVRQNLIEAAENQNYPLETLVYKLGLEYNESDFPLFDTAVLLKNIHDKKYLHLVKPNILFSFYRNEGLIEGELEYNTLHYKKSTIERLIDHAKNLLHAVVFNPGIRAADIDILSEVERKQLLVDFNDNNAYFPRDKTIYHFIQRHAEKNPDKIAISYEGNILTYGQLNSRVNQLARVLEDNGIQRGQLVGILLNRSPFMLECILAAWKVGGAYIPLDTNSPVQRIISILKDAAASALFTRQEHLKPKLEKILDAKIMVTEHLEQKLNEKNPSNPNLKLNMNDIAYVIYTSGSTGRPKGAVVEHIGMMNHIQAKIHDLQLTDKSIIGQNASHFFDISVWQFFAALMVGGKTVIYPDECILEPEQFLSKLMKEQVTILEVVPSYLSLMLSILDLEFKPLDSLAYLLVTGETVKPELVKRWFEKYPDSKMVNAYGPTEASDDITHYNMDEARKAEQISIGKPLQNLSIYIVDEYMRLCPVGVKGEIVVSGTGVGKGYLNDPEKTNRVFMKDPFVKDKDARLYKTGDLGCWRPEGNIDFFGRKDYQVKIRGYRIELEEIEKKILEYKGVREAVVIEKENFPDNIPGAEPTKYLGAFLEADSRLDFSAVKEYLEGVLPDYMIPDYIEQLEQMPLTPNGKIDRKALAKLEVSLPEDGHAAASSEIEKKLVEIWSNILKIDKDAIGIDSNFFHLGGHSLRATLLMVKVRREFDVNIQLKDIFELPTIRQFSKFIQKSVKDKFVSIEPVEQKEYYPLSSAQGRLFFIQLLEPKGVAYNLPTANIYEEELDKAKWEETFRKIIARHEVLRTSFLIIDEEPVQRIHDEVDFEIEYHYLPVEDIEDKSNLSYERFINNRFVRPFDLFQAPLLRVGLIKLQEKRYILMIDVHHIVVDGFSGDTLRKDFMALYSGKELSPLKLQYKDYSLWQIKSLHSPRIKKVEEYWLRQFEGGIPSLNLLTDYERTENVNFEGVSFDFPLGENLTERLRQLIKDEETTMYIFLNAVYNILLSIYTGQDDIVVGCGIAGRAHADLENIIGMFVNMLAMRNRPGKNKTFREFLEEVNKNALDAFENQDYQFDELVKKLGLPRDWRRNPLFDTQFTFQNFYNIEEPVEENSLQLRDFGFKTEIMPFELSLSGLETKETIIMRLIYVTSLFDSTTIEKMAKYYVEILEQVLDNRDIKIEDIEISHEMSSALSDFSQDEYVSFEF